MEVEKKDYTSDNESDEDSPPQLVQLPGFEDHKVVPITLLTGFLGSGKTTLLNHILTAQHGKRIAVIENEFSAGLGIEGMIAKSGMDGSNISDFVELTNGCICCSIKGDLLITLEKLVKHKERFDYIIIETTGLANPGPVISSFWSDEAIMSNVKLDGVICLVDCLNIRDYLSSPDISTDARTQICYSDRILLNKTDLISADQVPDIEETIRTLNSIADVRLSQYSKVDLDFVLNINSYSADAQEQQDLDRVIQCMPCTAGLPVQPPMSSIAAAPAPKPGSAQLSEASLRSLLHVKQDEASPHLASVLMTHSIKIDGALQLKPLEVYLDNVLFSSRSDEVMTAVKERIESNKDRQTVAAAVTVPEYGKITKLTDSSLAEHVATFDEKSRVFRMKGVVHIEDSDELYILQSVHEVFELKRSSIQVGSPADKTNGSNVFIVIGKNISVAEIEAGLKECLASS